MKITKCDVCKKTIKDNSNNVHIGIGACSVFNSFEMCSTCGKPILKMLKSKKLIDEKNEKIRKK